LTFLPLYSESDAVRAKDDWNTSDRDRRPNTQHICKQHTGLNLLKSDYNLHSGTDPQIY